MAVHCVSKTDGSTSWATDAWDTSLDCQEVKAWDLLSDARVQGGGSIGSKGRVGGPGVMEVGKLIVEKSGCDKAEVSREGGKEREEEEEEESLFKADAVN